VLGLCLYVLSYLREKTVCFPKITVVTKFYFSDALTLCGVPSVSSIAPKSELWLPLLVAGFADENEAVLRTSFAVSFTPGEAGM
jgi:hypothetical protein